MHAHWKHAPNVAMATAMFRWTANRITNRSTTLLCSMSINWKNIFFFIEEERNIFSAILRAIWTASQWCQPTDISVFSLSYLSNTSSDVLLLVSYSVCNKDIRCGKTFALPTCARREGCVRKCRTRDSFAVMSCPSLNSSRVVTPTMWRVTVYLEI